MKRTGLGGILALLLCLGLVSLEARGDDLQRFFAQMQREAASKPVARRPAKPSGVIGEKAFCSALCEGGTTVSVNCSSCTAVDQNCSVNQRGYAQCSGGSPVYCPYPCCTAQCQGGATVSVGCTGSCTYVDQACPYEEEGYVQCNGGDRVYCPSTTCQPQACHASVGCGDDDPVECEGFDDCQSLPGFCAVRCDGIFYSCPGLCT